MVSSTCKVLLVDSILIVIEGHVNAAICGILNSIAAEAFIYILLNV